MKKTFLSLIVSLFMTGTMSAQPAGAMNAAPHPLPPGGAKPGSPSGMLTPDEWQELRTAHNAALQANPSLIVHAQQLAEKMRTFQDKLNAAMIRSDPTLAPLLAKFEVSRPHPSGPATTSTAPTVSASGK